MPPRVNGQISLTVGPSKGTDDVLGDRDYNLFVMMTQTSRLMFQVREDELGAYDISNIESGVLFAVDAIEKAGGKATLGEIARWLLRRPHTITQLIDRMEKKGLVTKLKLPGQRNSKRIVLTEQGRQAYQSSTRRRAMRRLMSVLSEEERQELWSCLSKLSGRAIKDLGLRNGSFYPLHLGSR
ncbi:MAG: MarR family transcriptional regulator [Chloroflexi bacterium]|nr:MarR family transcriptional regulator [Chloroflexota bacterium]